MRIIHALGALPGRIAVALLNILPQRRLESLVAGVVARRASILPSDEALRFIFRLDAAFYPLVGRYASAYGGGAHTKIRHTRYHDFFLARCRKGERVLDVGCGSGHLARLLAEKSGCAVVGIDKDAEKISLARSLHAHPDLELVAGDATISVPEGRYDVVILSNVLEHLTDRSQFLKRLKDRIGPARFLIRVPLFERDWRVPLKRELGVEWRLDTTHETEYTLETFAREISEAGLAPVHQEVRWGEIWAELRPFFESDH